ncbi:phosphatidylglycerophosphatase A [Halomonas cupida]|uniref:phosphatidylglycerophosphatase A family protein n=1 Tax=Halomonas cupida TaxID=44933 RepID=UPI0039B6B949
MQDILIWLASGLGLGLSPRAPGTVGSLLAIPLAWWLLSLPQYRRIIISLILIFAAIPLCDAASRWLGGGDVQQIVADEIVAMPLAVILLSAATRVWSVPLGYVLFRVFDIIKPFPVGWAEGLDGGGGLGIVADDVVAAIYAAIIIAVIYRLTRGRSTHSS